MSSAVLTKFLSIPTTTCRSIIRTDPRHLFVSLCPVKLPHNRFCHTYVCWISLHHDNRRVRIPLSSGDDWGLRAPVAVPFPLVPQEGPGTVYQPPHISNALTQTQYYLGAKLKEKSPSCLKYFIFIQLKISVLTCILLLYDISDIYVHYSILHICIIYNSAIRLCLVQNFYVICTD